MWSVVDFFHSRSSARATPRSRARPVKSQNIWTEKLGAILPPTWDSSQWHAIGQSRGYLVRQGSLHQLQGPLVFTIGGQSVNARCFQAIESTLSEQSSDNFAMLSDGTQPSLLTMEACERKHVSSSWIPLGSMGLNSYSLKQQCSRCCGNIVSYSSIRDCDGCSGRFILLLLYFDCSFLSLKL